MYNEVPQTLEAGHGGAHHRRESRSRIHAVCLMEMSEEDDDEPAMDYEKIQ